MAECCEIPLPPGWIKYVLSVAWYFAYGSNMDAPQMAERAPGAMLRGVATLEGHRFLITGGGYASVMAAPGKVVYGVVWEIEDRHEEALDLYEGVTHGWYHKALRSVMLQSGERGDALLYLAADERPGAPKPGYLERVMEAARGHGLPEAYLKQLAGWRSGGPPTGSKLPGAPPRRAR
jgi:cation transport regulator ChaC